MASGHTPEVRRKPGTIQTSISYIRKAEYMQQFKTESLSIYHQNHTKLSLHSLPAIDINPIVKIIITDLDQRHCSTAFYQ